MGSISRSAKIFVTGHRGVVGNALARRLFTCSHAAPVFLAEVQADHIFIAAPKIGGLQVKNVYRADLLHQNRRIGSNLIHSAYLAGVQHLMFFEPSCIYPHDCLQSIRLDCLLIGPSEATNDPYALTKIAGTKLAESYNQQHGRQYVSVMPTNLYGPNDHCSDSSTAAMQSTPSGAGGKVPRCVSS